MKTKSIYKSALIRNENLQNKYLRVVKARRVQLKSNPDIIFFAHKTPYQYLISEALSGAIVSEVYGCNRTLQQAIKSAEKQISEKLTKKSLKEYITDYILQNKIYPLNVNVKQFS